MFSLELQAISIIFCVSPELQENYNNGIVNFGVECQITANTYRSNC